MVFTLCTEAQADLAIGQDSSAAQTLQANVQIWVLYAESDMENAFGNNIGLVANEATTTAALKQWLAGVVSHRAAWYAFQQDQNSWSLSTTQSKLNVSIAIWKGFLSDLKERRPDIVADLNL